VSLSTPPNPLAELRGPLLRVWGGTGKQGRKNRGKKMRNKGEGKGKGQGMHPSNEGYRRPGRRMHIHHLKAFYNNSLCV